VGIAHDDGVMTELTLFVVDDDDGLRAAIAEVVAATRDCSLWGAAASGEEALARFALCTGGDRPDVVLLDVELPGIDGFEVAARLAAIDSSVAIVLMSTHSRDDLPNDALARVARFVPKVELSPTTLSSLRNLVGPSTTR
jgi:DNA-binding NarL/FixJ family response regulator